YAVAVEPGHYELAGFIGTFMDHRPTGQGTFPQFGPFQVSSNAATYIGDFNTYASIGPAVQTWGIRSFTNNFAASTGEFRLKCTNLASAQVVSAFDQVSTDQTP